MTERQKGRFQGHCACEKCGSSDNGSYYLNEDGTHSFYCWTPKCFSSTDNFDISTMKGATYTPARVLDMAVEREKMKEVKENLAALDFPQRKLRQDVYEFYGVRMSLEDNGEEIKGVYYPTYRDGQHVGYRNRLKYESWMDQVKKKPHLEGVLKNFNGGIGDTKKGIEMYGQHLFPSGGKRIIITCGEEDCHTVYHMTSLNTKFSGGYPTVSVPSGENIAFVKPNLPYLSSFDEIYVVGDADKAGESFVEQLCKILPVGKVRLVRLPKGFKDPSELWTKTKNREKAAREFYFSLFNAEKYSPAGVMSLSEGWKAYKNRGQEVLIPFPDSFGDLNELTFGGYALSEIINIIAPSSVGKSSFVKEMLYTALQKTPYNIGVISLEETIDEFIEGLLSIHMSTQLNEVSYDKRDGKAEYEAFQELLRLRPKDTILEDGDDTIERVHFLDHQGACTGDELLEKIDFLINGLDCKIIIVDPVTLGFSGRDTDQDEMASEIVKRVKGKKVAWINVHHVRKSLVGGTANSEGGDLAEEDIKGTGAWFQIGMINLIFTRNKVHENNIIKNTTTGKMSKCRRHGKSTGRFGWIYYNPETGRLEKGSDPAEILAEEGFTYEDDEEQDKKEAMATW
jgi:KaiC/GvpD/RAD55 family RecA-like ATPase